MTRQNYYSRRQARQRQKVDTGLIGNLVVQERQQQPRIGTRKLHRLYQATLLEAGVKVVTLQVGSWDTHSGNFAHMRRWLPVLDRALKGL
jgi:uncharacterized protein (DUF1501 family)